MPINTLKVRHKHYILLILNTLASVCGFSQTEESIASHKMALANSESDTAYCRILTDLADDYLYLNPDSAQHYGKKAVEFALAHGDKKNLAQAYNTLGIIQFDKSYLTGALENFQNAYELYLEIGDKKGQGKILNNLGVIYSETEEYETAIQKYQESFKINTSIENWETASTALYNIASNEMSLKKYTEAQYTIDELIKFKALHPESISPDQLLADYYLELNQHDSAEFYLSRTLVEMDKTGNLYYLASGQISLTEIYLKTGRIDEARAQLEATEQFVRSNEYLEMMIDLLEVKSEVYAALGDPTKALQYQIESSDLKDSLNHINRMNFISELSAQYNTDRAEAKITQQDGIIATNKKWLFTIGIFSCLLLVVLGVMYFIYRKNRNLNHLLKVQNSHINVQRQKIVSSINYAKKIQQSSLPREAEFKKIFRDSFVYFKPKDIISGDFFSYQEIDGKVYIAAIDCTGHGVPGALMSLIANAKLNKVVNEMGYRDPGEILCAMHYEIQMALRQDSDSESAQDGVEMNLCAIDQNKKTISYAGANSPISIVHKGLCTEQKGSPVGLGGTYNPRQLIAGKAMFITEEFSYQDGDSLFLYSDGFHDQIGGEANKKFNKENFRKMISEISQHRLRNAKDTCQQILSEWQGKNSQTDDIMLIGILL
jgi:serine phosphatase RsbU (regulator of sigma subunit)